MQNVFPKYCPLLHLLVGLFTYDSKDNTHHDSKTTKVGGIIWHIKSWLYQEQNLKNT